jgi:hypothetical protein
MRLAAPLLQFALASPLATTPFAQHDPPQPSLLACTIRGNSVVQGRLGDSAVGEEHQVPSQFCPTIVPPFWQKVK